VKMTEDVPAQSGPAILAGKTIVVTGALVNYQRVDIERRITELGGKAAGSVSKNTSFVLAGTGSSTRSKLAKAQELGVKVISEEEFEQMVKDLQAAAGSVSAPVAPPRGPLGRPRPADCWRARRWW
jgi:DNA ligase (NAD+)